MSNVSSGSVDTSPVHVQVDDHPTHRPWLALAALVLAAVAGVLGVTALVTDDSAPTTRPANVTVVTAGRPSPTPALGFDDTCQPRPFVRVPC